MRDGPNDADVVRVDLRRMLVVVESGEEIPITHRFNAAGQPTSDNEQTFSVVAGPRRDGKWVSSQVDREERGLG